VAWSVFSLWICVDVDVARATDLSHSAAELGDAVTIMEIREYYRHVSEEIFFKYTCISSMLGSSLGSYWAGYYLENGTGCEKDVDKAIVYYKRGAHAGDGSCCRELIRLLANNELAAFYSVLCHRLDASHSHPTHLLPYIAAAEIRATAEFPSRVLPEYNNNPIPPPPSLPHISCHRLASLSCLYFSSNYL